ncbi:MAG: hypothetical protein P8Y28_02150 [Gammaproteobacteria bacterium]|jgi:hypothetical protein
MKLSYIVLLVVCSATMVACSKSGDEENSEHLLSGQQRALERAKDVNNVLQQSEEKKRQQLEEMER